MSTRSTICFIAIFPFVTTCFGYHPDQGATPVFTAGTEFVQVPVIVQRSGKHVPGLGKETFALRQDGKEQPIASFEEIHRAIPEASTSSADDVSASQSNQQVTIIALDLVDTPNLDRAYFSQELERYLKKPERLGGPIGLVAVERNGVRVLREFTTDPNVLLSAVAKVSARSTTANNETAALTRATSDESIRELETGELSSEQQQRALARLKLREADEAVSRFQDRSSRIDTQLAIQQLAQALKGIPGRKSLLLVGSGFKFIDSRIVIKFLDQGQGSSATSYSADNANETLDQAAYTWKLLNDANVAVYPIDTRRTVNTAFQTMDTSGANAPTSLSYEQNRQADMDVLDTFRTIAAATGGKACFYRTDLDNCLREAVDDDHDYYLLGFYADKKNRKPGWHKIEVKVNEKANIRYRQGFMITKFNPSEQRKTDISLALRSPFAYTELPIQCSFRPQLTKDGKKLTPFHIFVPPATLAVDESSGRMDFDVIALARGDGGKEAGHFNQHIDRKFPPESIAEIKRIGIDYTNRLDLSPGEYAVWFVIRDNIGGRTGSSVVRLKVP